MVNQLKFDSKRLALLASLVALNSVVRLLGVGVAGMETAFALLIIGASVFGPTFGASLGALSLLTSAAIGAGVGPWLPFQMISAALVGLAAGFLPKPKNMRIRLFWLCSYGVISSYVYGLFMTAWTWPLFVGAGSSVAFLAGGSIWENTWRLLVFDFVSGGFIWNTGRAITTVTLLLLTGKTLVTTLERATTRVFVKFEA